MIMLQDRHIVTHTCQRTGLDTQVIPDHCQFVPCSQTDSLKAEGLASNLDHAASFRLLTALGSSTGANSIDPDLLVFVAGCAHANVHLSPIKMDDCLSGGRFIAICCIQLVIQGSPMLP